MHTQICHCIPPLSQAHSSLSSSEEGLNNNNSMANYEKEPLACHSECSEESQ